MPDGIIEVSDRPRAQHAHQRVLAATAQLLREGEVAHLTIERIAEASGVSTATIYKHWPSKTAVAAEAFGHAAGEALPLPAGTDALADLLEFTVNAVVYFGSPSNNVFTQLLAACASEPSGATYFRTFYLTPRRDLLRPLWDRARAAGLVRTDTDADTAFDVLFGAAVFRMLSSGEDLNPDVAREIVRTSLGGLLTGGAA